MKFESTHRTRTSLAMAVVAALALGVMVQPAGAQPTRGAKKATKSKTEDTRTPATRLSDEQRQQVQEIIREHREASRQELREKLSKVMTPEQLEQFDQRWENRSGDARGMRGDRPRHGRRDFRSQERWSRGGCRGGGCCGDVRGGRGGRGGWDGPRMGMGRGMGMDMGKRGPEFREERGERMVERLSIVLDLTPEQREKVEGIVKEHHEQFKDFDPSKLTFDERQKTREAHRTLLMNRLKEVLTPEQARKLDELHETRGPRGMRG